MVDGEPQLMAVLALLPRRAVGRAAADAGVVDQHVQRGGRAPRPPRRACGPRRARRGRPGTSAHPPSSALSSSSFSRLRPWSSTFGPAGGQVARDATAEAVGRAGDQDGRLLDRSHARVRLARRVDMRTYVRALERPGDRGGGAGAPAGLRGGRGAPFRRSGGARHPVLRGPRQVGPQRGAQGLAHAVPMDDQPVSRMHACVPLLLRPPHARVPRPQRRARFRQGDRGQGQRAGGAAGRAGAAVVEARARRARDEHGPVPVGRGALQADARDLGGDAGLREPVLDPHEVAAAAARQGPAAAGQGADERQRVPVGADAGREGVAGDRAAHAASPRAAGGGGGAQPDRHPHRDPDRAADAGDQRRAGAGGADRRAGRGGGGDLDRRPGAVPARLHARRVLRLAAGQAPRPAWSPTSSCTARGRTCSRARARSSRRGCPAGGARGGTPRRASTARRPRSRRRSPSPCGRPACSEPAAPLRSPGPSVPELAVGRQVWPRSQDRRR